MIDNTGKIHKVITYLKEIKASSFTCSDGPFNFDNVTETCRIIDTLMLPLYYIWDYCCHQQLEDICEEHLRKPYQRFLHNPITYTWKLYVFINLKKPFTPPLADNKIYDDISALYIDLINFYERESGAGTT